MFKFIKSLIRFKNSEVAPETLETHTPVIFSFDLEFNDPISFRSVPHKRTHRTMFVPTPLLVNYDLNTNAEWFNRLILSLLDNESSRFFSEDDLCQFSELRLYMKNDNEMYFAPIFDEILSVNQNHISKDNISKIELSNTAIGVKGSKLLTLTNFNIEYSRHFIEASQFKNYMYKHKQVAICMTKSKDKLFGKGAVIQ